MAGTFPGIANTQDVDRNGVPLRNSVLTVYQGGTLTLANVYQDIGLAIPAQNPMTADITGRKPLFYVADGTYRVRLVDQYGVQVYDYPQVPSIGASSSGGGGSAVDPTTIFNTGDPIWVPISGTRTGWVRANGRTIGSATSGASERANADCQNLFLYLWNTYPDSRCPVSGGRGVSAAADWAANKTIALLDMRARGPFGLDDMGNSAAGRLAGATFTGADTATTAAGIGGEGAHTLTPTELAAHIHANTLNDPGHTHANQGVTALATGGSAARDAAAVTGATGSSPTGVTITNASAGGGASHNTMPPFMLGSWYLKL